MCKRIFLKEYLKNLFKNFKAIAPDILMENVKQRMANRLTLCVTKIPSNTTHYRHQLQLTTLHLSITSYGKRIHQHVMLSINLFTLAYIFNFLFIVRMWNKYLVKSIVRTELNLKYTKLPIHSTGKLIELILITVRHVTRINRKYKNITRLMKGI